MIKNKLKLQAAAGVVLLVLLYLVSLCFRGFFLPEEYMFAVKLKGIFPDISGTYLPKLPAALATLLTGGILWLTAMKFKLLHPGSAAGIYLCFPLVWWLGTSALPSPVLAFLIDLAAAGLFFARREERLWLRLCGFAAGLLGAVGAALLAGSSFFDWSGVIMAFMPVLALIAAIRLEKLDDRQVAERRIDRFSIGCAVASGMLLVFFLLPSFARMLKVGFPAELTVFQGGERVYRTALALLIPMLWIYIVFQVKSYFEKLYVLLLAIGFVLLALPPSLPWGRLARVPQPEQLELIFPEVMRDRPVFFADDTGSAALCYVFDVKAQQVGRNQDDLPPVELPGAVENALKTSDVVVVSCNGELDSFLPSGRSSIKNTLHKCKFFRFTGDVK